MAVNSANIELTREELYERVWSTPMSRLAAEFGLSDVGLAKVCKRHKIPRPSRGYWAKLERKKEVKRWPLMPTDDESLKKIRFCRTETPAIPKANQPIAADPEIAALIEAESAQEKQIKALTDLRGADPLVTATRESLAKEKADEYGRISRRYGFCGSCFDVRVSKQNIHRALLLLHSLVRAFRSRGYRLGDHDERSARPYVEVLGRRFRVSIWEPSKRQKKKEEEQRCSWRTRDYKYVPSGVLEIHLDRDSYSSASKVCDTKRKALEQRLNELIVCMLKTVDREKVEEEERRRAAAEAEIVKRAAIEKEVIARSDDVRESRLLKAVPKWENALRLRSFIQAVRKAALQRFGTVGESSEVGLWLRWAEEYLTSIDPLSDRRELPTYSLTAQEIEQLRKECDSDWRSWSKTFRPRQPR